MSALDKLRDIGLSVQSIRGFVALVTVAPTVLTFVLGLLEHRPWSEVVAVVMVTLAAGAALAYYGIRLFQAATSYLTGRKDQKRIADMLRDLRDSGETEVDTATAAAIWAGSMDESNVMRHVRFRQIKAIIRRGDIKNTRQAAGGGKGPNIHTWIRIAELERYFGLAGIMK